MIVLVLSGCTASGEQTHQTGSMECVGYCALTVNRTSTEVVTEPDGTVTKSSSSDGIIAKDIMKNGQK